MTAVAMDGTYASCEDENMEQEEEEDDFDIYVVASTSSQSITELPRPKATKHKKEKHKPVVAVRPGPLHPVSAKRKRVTALDELTRSPPRPRVQPAVVPPVTTEELTDIVLSTTTDVEEPKKNGLDTLLPYTARTWQRQERGASDQVFTCTRRKSTRPLAVTCVDKMPVRPVLPLGAVGPIPTLGSRWDLSSYRHWIGLGAPDHSSSRESNWSIQDWLLNGFKRKLRSETQ